MSLKLQQANVHIFFENTNDLLKLSKMATKLS